MDKDKIQEVRDCIATISNALWRAETLCREAGITSVSIPACWTRNELESFEFQFDKVVGRPEEAGS